MPRGRYTKRHKEAARLYLMGPEGIRSDWAEACREAGFTRVPDIEGVAVQAAFADWKREGENTPSVADVPKPPDDDAVALERLLEVENPDWDELARLAKRVLVKIGTGLMGDSSSYQVTALKEIIARAEGRVGQKKEDVEHVFLGLVVLPVLRDVPTSEVVIVDVEDME